MTVHHQPASWPITPPGSQSHWPRKTRIVVSILLLGHLLAVFLPPLAFQAVGPLGLSPAVASAMLPIEHYSQVMHLNRGYAFFAPDPGPSHLIQAGLTDDSGTLTEKLYPDLQLQWPRLLYHRHFMLAEFLNDAHLPPGPSAELIKEDPEGAARWRDARARYEHLRHSMAMHLQHTHPGTTVAIQRIEHLIPGVIEFQEQPIALTDTRLYQVLLDSPQALQSEDRLITPNRLPEAIPAPDAQQPKEPTPQQTTTESLQNEKSSNLGIETELGTESPGAASQGDPKILAKETDS